ncbi:hypothetical protein AeMF1_020106 [Aphanomyces euteiches]|nr:hypothetical protein AeMF1_020106 [Aphanomyces euteiches]KAH9184422.1 hypothetical protein AeNC1_013604 [Aphanomyces euteiches]
MAPVDITQLRENEDEMWTTVCNLILEQPSGAETNASAASMLLEQSPLVCSKRPAKTKRIRLRTAKSEICQLKDEIRELQAQLRDAKRVATLNSSMSMWERTALSQCVEKNKALHENLQLHIAVRERSEYIERLQKIILKTPRWTALSAILTSNDTTLPAAMDDRIAAIHRIADREYQRQETVFVQAGALGLPDGTYKVDVFPHANQQFIFRSTSCIPLAAPVETIARHFWAAMSEQTPIDLMEGEIETWEQVDENTIYQHSHGVFIEGTMFHSNVIRKCYEDEHGRVVIVVVSVPDDETTEKRSECDAVDDSVGWLVFTPNQNELNTSSLSIVCQCNITRLVQVSDAVKVTDEAIRILKRLFKPRQGLFDAIPLAQFQAFSQIGERNRLGIVHEAVRKFLQTRRPVSM